VPESPYVEEPSAPSLASMRRGALAVSVLDDLDLLPDDSGVVLSSPPAVRVSWAELRRCLAGADPEDPDGRDRLGGWLRARRWVADVLLSDLAERARPVGVPVDSPAHPGLDWVQRRVLGDALDLGLGFLGLSPDAPDDVVVVSQGVIDSAGIDADPWWSRAEAYLETMGARAAERWQRDPAAPLRPMGDCDVVTLLGSATLRAALAGASGGLCPAAVPMRTRGWLDLSRIDPAFAPAAAAATDATERGFDRPLLLTAEEVALVPEGGRAAESALADRCPEGPWTRDVLYR
jgi:hypothetical protein